MRRFTLAAPAITLLAIAASAIALEDRTLELPSDYKTSFDNYMVSDRLGQDDQVMSYYANDIALEGAQIEGRLLSGSVLIGEIYGAVTDADGKVIESPLGRRVRGELKAIVLMERRDGWGEQYPDGLKGGDWEYEVFSAAGENLGKDTTACRECHEPMAENEYTWSFKHLAAAR